MSPSAACTTKICYKLPPLFKDVADTLKSRYDDARQVEFFSNKIIPLTSPSRRNADETNDVVKAVADKDLHLLYHDASPSYCDQNERLGITGTKGRKCSLDLTSGLPHCNQLCCGRGYHTKTYRAVKKCRCKFVYCCTIKCEQCNVMQTDYICK